MPELVFWIHGAPGCWRPLGKLLGLMLMEMVNISFKKGGLLATLTEASVQPGLKKPPFENGILANYIALISPLWVK